MDFPDLPLGDDDLQAQAVAAFYVPVGGSPFGPYERQEPPDYIGNLDAAWGLLQRIGADRPVSLHGHIFSGEETWICHIPPFTVFDPNPARAIVTAALKWHSFNAHETPTSVAEESETR